MILSAFKRILMRLRTILRLSPYPKSIRLYYSSMFRDLMGNPEEFM